MAGRIFRFFMFIGDLFVATVSLFFLSLELFDAGVSACTENTQPKQKFTHTQLTPPISQVIHIGLNTTLTHTLTTTKN